MGTPQKGGKIIKSAPNIKMSEDSESKTQMDQREDDSGMKALGQCMVETKRIISILNSMAANKMISKERVADVEADITRMCLGVVPSMAPTLHIALSQLSMILFSSRQNFKSGQDNVIIFHGCVNGAAGVGSVRISSSLSDEKLRELTNKSAEDLTTFYEGLQNGRRVLSINLVVASGACGTGAVVVDSGVTPTREQTSLLVAHCASVSKVKRDIHQRFPGNLMEVNMQPETVNSTCSITMC